MTRTLIASVGRCRISIHHNHKVEDNQRIANHECALWVLFIVYKSVSKLQCFGSYMQHCKLANYLTKLATWSYNW